MNRQNRFTGIFTIILILAAFSFMRGDSIFSRAYLLDKLLLLPGIIIGLAFHEYAHALVSYKLGDPTPKLQGRLTINPFSHIDPIGFIMLMVAGFGWGIPVQIDPRYYKNRRRDEALVASAGVTMNLIIAIVFTIIFKIVLNAFPAVFSSEAGVTLSKMIQYAILINIVLMIFNLLPLPPLDGFNIITQIFKLDRYPWYGTIMRYGYVAVLLLVFLNLTKYIISPIIYFIFNTLINFAIS